jgi:type IV pilus assembly protein PilY1
MRKVHVFALFLVSLMLGYSASLRAEDIDIYVSNSTNVGVPNVLFVIFNGADVDADAGSSCTYSDGTTPSTGGSKVDSLIQCSLVSAINSLTDGSVNIGIAVSNANSFDGQSQATTDTTRGGFHDLCNASGNGGCIIRKLMNMNTAGKASMTAFIKGLKQFNGGQTDADGINVKVNTASADPAAAMQEAWAYYNGKTGLSGTSYTPSILANGCQRNFVVYIGTSAKSIPTLAGTAGITAAQVGASTAQLTQITGTSNFNPNICGVSSSALSSGNDYGDEWARVMYLQDGGASGNFGTQNIITYGINVEAAPNKCFADAPAMISSMAKVGGGKFFDATNAVDLTTALNTILNEVQAVNSVFSSASLPVSVNAQGTYLNQIYLGMFRPDANASPRWLGNLKQFKLVKDASGNLVLGDSAGNSAISASGTGFISPTSVSYWTYKNTGAAPDNITSNGYTGFFANNAEGTPLSGYDSPDGEVVEKGGAAQQLRKENLTATFAGSSNTANTNPRRMYTYCPSGSSCNTDLTNSANDFSTANGNIATAAFGLSSTIRINSITRSGTTVTATTSGSHGLSSGTSVVVSGADQSEYNGTFTLTSASGSTFTYSIAAEYPNVTSTVAYNVSKSAGSAVNLTGVTRSSSTATITSASSLAAFTVGSSITISGFNQSEYNGQHTVLSNSGTSLTYTVTNTPPTTATNTYQAYYTTLVTSTISGITVSGSGANKVATISTTSAHGFHTGQTVTLAGTGKAVYDGVSFAVNTVPSGTQFTIKPGNSATTATAGTAKNSQTAQTITLTRSGTTATAAGVPASWFTNGDTVTIAKTAGSATNETAYEKSSVVITCTTTCTSFTYTITTSPVSPGTFSGTPTVSPVGGAGTIAAGGITRTAGSTTATAVQTISTGTFANGDTVTLSQQVAAGNESAYAGSFVISCSGLCTTFTFSGFALTPTTPATGSSLSVYSSSTPPDRDTVIKWLRGADNYGDESGPGSTVKVRPSIHADVLHSRPLVINYGGASDKIVVYYGTNDGVFHAVNGNQTAAISGVPAGDELWGLVLTDHYANINRQRLATPELKFPTTQLASATTKDYFVDGPTGAYQKLNADGTINTAYLFMTMRRGGRFIYALDVTDPVTPKFLWKIDANTTGFDELGQTWSRPRLTQLQSSTYKTTPVLVFGGGYDTSEDSEPPGTDTAGRAIYVVNAATGALIWSASPECTTSSTCLQVPAMAYAVPSDMAFVDRDGDGYTDKIYFGDLGGNVWRADVADASTSNWKVTKVAALGCDTGTCASGTTPRKFFFPPAVLSVKASGASGSYDAVSVVSGDREHPLKSANTSSAYFTADKFFMIMDQTTIVNPSTFTTTGVTMASLDATAGGTVDWAPTSGSNGFSISLQTGEKGVNAPLAVNGSVFFSTNQPAAASATCSANLGTARAYAVSPFTGESASNVLSGGGLPPSPVAGLVSVTTGSGASAVTTEEKFCIGCGLATPPGTTGSTTTCTGNAALQNCTPAVTIPSNLKRTYWYKK